MVLIDNCEVSVFTTIEVSEKMGVFGSAGAGWLNIELGRSVIEFNPRSINFLLPFLFGDGLRGAEGFFGGDGLRGAEDLRSGEFFLAETDKVLEENFAGGLLNFCFMVWPFPFEI